MTETATLKERLAALTPTEDLILEVLMARHRLGESSWPFSSKLLKSANRMEAAGLITIWSGPVEKTFAASLRTEVLDHYKLEPRSHRASDTEPVKGEYIPPVNRDYADRIAAYLKRVGAEKMAHQAVARLFGSDRP